jgi:hypothetical protein
MNFIILNTASLDKRMEYLRGTKSSGSYSSSFIDVKEIIYEKCLNA